MLASISQVRKLMPQYGEVVYATNIERDYEHKEAYQLMNSISRANTEYHIVFIWPEFKAMDSVVY